MNRPSAVLVFVCLLLVVIPLVVHAEPPKCILEVTPLSGTAPLTITASEISGDKEIVDWQFNFGDGSNPVVKSPVVEHTYTAPGEYTVWLGVVNEKGEESTDTVLVTVTAPELKQPDENTTTKVVWEGTRTISDAITASVLTKDTAIVLKEETNKVMAAVHFPYNVTKPEAKTTFRIVKYKCDDKMGICGYWIEATRDGKEIYTNSPIWISPPPYQVVVSESFDEKTNEITTTLKEDPKAAVEATLQRYVEMQPLGKAVSYER